MKFKRSRSTPSALTFHFSFSMHSNADDLFARAAPPATSPPAPLTRPGAASDPPQTACASGTTPVVEDDKDSAPRDLSTSTPSSSAARDLVSSNTSLAAAHFAAASRAHLAIATEDLNLAKRVNTSVASAASSASSDLAGWSDLRDALSEKLAALGTLTAESIKKALEPRVEALEKEANDLDDLSKKLARAVGVSSEEEDQEGSDDDNSDGESTTKKKKKPPSSSFSSAASSATAVATSAASAVANAANSAASKLWNRWAPGEKGR